MNADAITIGGMMFELGELDDLPLTFDENSGKAPSTMSPSTLTSGWYSGSRMEKKSKRDYETKQKQTQVAGMILSTWVCFSVCPC